MLEITGATLLSTEEARQLDEKILKSPDVWWLRSRGDDTRSAACVNACGYVYDSGYDVRQCFGVRPALEINLEGSGLQIGDKFTLPSSGTSRLIGDYNFTIISDKYALCDMIVWRSIFREDGGAKDANDYEASDVKKFVDD